ncbi:MAG: T9SS type A sorting domain-containing protein [Bacteroidales bacterium]|nr:T9SS type A sorting domain-containing protein [Bacteroidales bacterium]
MKRFLLFVLLFVPAFCFSQAKSVLFIGNSYTYYNGGVEVMLSNIASSMGETVEVEAYTSGGAKFSDFCNYAETYSRISSRSWDYIVLQEQSQLPSFPPSQVEAECLPYAKILCDSIRALSPCSEILFFMTWGRQNGDPINCQYYAPLCTYEGMQQRLRESYVEMAFENNALVVPVGMAWKEIRDNYPAINLYQSDESHPSVEGTYLAAWTFFETIFGINNTGLDTDISFFSTLDEETAVRLRTAAYNAVHTNMSEWNYTVPKFKQFSANTATVVMPAYADSCFVDFGFGESLSLTADAFTVQNDRLVYVINLEDYLPQETATVELCVKIYCGDCCIGICNDFLYEYEDAPSCINEAENNALSFENPVKNGRIVLSESLNEDYSIFSTDGRLVATGNLNGNEIDVRNLHSGIYMLQIAGKTYRFVVEY